MGGICHGQMVSSFLGQPLFGNNFRSEGLKEDHAAQSQQNNPRAFLQITGKEVELQLMQRFSHFGKYLLPEWGRKWTCCYRSLLPM
ncbi:hypothetical protein CY35_16G011100 [Sphagnum magellanicum]|nr:hypothetical protein CY35_16G011100 [Sphagnum magellanicum]